MTEQTNGDGHVRRRECALQVDAIKCRLKSTEHNVEKLFSKWDKLLWIQLSMLATLVTGIILAAIKL